MINLLKKLCIHAINNKILINKNKVDINNINITEIKIKNLGHFQFNSIMKLTKITNTSPLIIAEKIKNYLILNSNNIFIKINITNPGFLNFTINNIYLNKKIHKMINNKNLDIKNTYKPLKIIVDYSGPNIAKEMHVGHLRSTIIGDFISRTLEYIGHNVIKINHVGDWGTQFGILINYIKKYKINYKDNSLKELSNYYKKSQIEFNNDPEFKLNSHNEVLKLQKKEISSMEIWKNINIISKIEYKKIYKLLDINIKTIGESFYKNKLKSIINLFEKKNLLHVSNKAKCIYIDGYKNKDNTNFPLIIQKKDGGFNYSTTELAAIYYRIKIKKINHIIYVTDISQKIHFEMVFKAAEKANITNNNTHLKHITFGFLLKSDGKKMKTRSGDSEKLITLINTSILKSKNIIKTRYPELNTKELNLRAKTLGINAIKYSDLSNNIKQSYKFSYEKMLKSNGNTAAFLTYAYTRIISIINNVEKIDINKLIKKHKINLLDITEIDLGIHLVKYEYIINKTINELNPNILTTYLYSLSEKFHIFFQTCKIINSQYTNDRLLLCEAIRKTLKQGLYLLGLTTLNKM